MKPVSLLDRLFGGWGFARPHFFAFWIAICLIGPLTHLPALGHPTPGPLGQLGGLTPPVSSGPPANVERFGTFETAPVYFENRLLFQVAAPTVWNRAAPGNQLLVEGRAEQIQTNLQRIVALEQKPDQRSFTTAFDPKTLRLEITSQNGQTLLRAWDEHHSQPQDLLTVTELDAKLYGLSIPELAQQRQQQLQTELEEALRARLPGAIAEQVQRALRVLLLTLGLSFGLWLVQRPIRQSARTMRSQRASHAEAAAAGMNAAELNGDRSAFGNPSPHPGQNGASADSSLDSDLDSDLDLDLLGKASWPDADRAGFSPSQTGPEQADRGAPGSPISTIAEPESVNLTHRFHFLNNLRTRFSLERRHSLNALLRWLLLWGQVTIWIMGVTRILAIFPQTQALAARVWSTPIALVIIWFTTGAVNRLGDVLINRFSRVLEEDEFFSFEGMQRKCLRLSTVIRVAKGIKTFGIYGLGCIWILHVLGVPLGSLLTVSAAIALAISLASQSLIKDLVNGVLILSEDQYGIGDFISVGTVTGLVENMNLRITQLRNAEGRLITIPNSLISQVENLTRTWSRVDFTIEVAYDADLRQALEALGQVCQQFYSEPDWQALLIKPPEVLGIEHLSHAGAQIRIWLQTQPLQQWKVGREFRLRVWQTLNDYQIEIGVPQQVFRSQPGTPGLADPTLDQTRPLNV